MQLVLIAGFLVYPGVGLIGLVFAGVWALIAYLRAEVLRRQQSGILPGHDPPPEDPPLARGRIPRYAVRRDTP